MTHVESTFFEWDAEFDSVKTASDYLMTAGGPLASSYAALTEQQFHQARSVQARLIVAESGPTASSVRLHSRCRIVWGKR